MGMIIELADQDYQYCLDYASGKTNIMALNNTNRIIKAVADGTRYEDRLKTDMTAILKDLQHDLCHELCKEIHKNEDCPCINQTTSCLATFRVCDADRAIGRVIQQKIDKLKENKE